MLSAIRGGLFGDGQRLEEAADFALGFGELPVHQAEAGAAKARGRASSSVPGSPRDARARNRSSCMYRFRAFCTRGRLEHQAALRLNFSRARAGVMYPCHCRSQPVVAALDEGPDPQESIAGHRPA